MAEKTCEMAIFLGLDSILIVIINNSANRTESRRTILVAGDRAPGLGDTNMATMRRASAGSSIACKSCRRHDTPHYVS
jgi:hypothetical protein